MDCKYNKMTTLELDVRRVPGYPFNVPPPFPVPQLRLLVPMEIPPNGNYKMVEAVSVSQSFLQRQQLRQLPLIGLGCTWDPSTRQWAMSDRDRVLHRQMVTDFHFKYGTLLKDYIATAESYQTKVLKYSEMKNADGKARNLEKNFKKDLSIITIGEFESDESDYETSSPVIHRKAPCYKNSKEIITVSSGLLLISLLEEDLIEKILMNLDSLSLMSMELTCSLFRDLIYDKNIWQKLSIKISKCDPNLNFEWRKKLIQNSMIKQQKRIIHKKTLIQFDRISQNFRRGSAILTECSQVKNGDNWMACDDRFIVDGGSEMISVLDRRGGEAFHIHVLNNWVIGITNDTLLTFDNRQHIIKLFVISMNQDELEDVSFVMSIGPIDWRPYNVSLMGDNLAICKKSTKLIEIYKVLSGHATLMSELIIPEGHHMPFFGRHRQSMDISDGKVFASLYRSRSYGEFHIEKTESRIMVSNLNGGHVCFICGMLDRHDEIASLKARDGFLYAVTRRRIQVWSETRKEVVVSKRVDVFNLNSSFRFPTLTVGLNDHVLIVASGKVLVTWDRKECERGSMDQQIQKYSEGQSMFSMQIMSVCDRSLLWKVELPVELKTFSLEAWRITFFPMYQGDNVMVLDFWY